MAEPFLAIPVAAMDYPDHRKRAFVFFLFAELDKGRGSAGVNVERLAEMAGLSRHQADRLVRQLRDKGFISFERGRRCLEVTRTWKAASQRDLPASQRDLPASHLPAPKQIVEPKRESARLTRDLPRRKRDFHVDQIPDPDFRSHWVNTCARVGWDKGRALDHLARAKQDTHAWMRTISDPQQVLDHLQWWASDDSKPAWYRKRDLGFVTLLRKLDGDAKQVRDWFKKRKNGFEIPNNPEPKEEKVDLTEQLQLLNEHAELMGAEEASRLAAEWGVKWVPPGGQIRISGKPTTEKA